ncbi:ArsR/SmtB family transcription factor [Phaeacidiphilus oryzae]|uniref:ArsR/SmtB family transcription factor n=1 Tax=Phaeacidiphilus oryzae TaxID=348818 RepID=UPI000691C577|nr:helix-turn-helix domain-containing protein [Phaeacidiphilus oryzae]
MTAPRLPRATPQVDLAKAAALFAVPARAEMLLALADRAECSAGELAAAAEVSASTASSHLAHLVDQGLLRVTPRGRARMYRLEGPHVRAALESLRLLAALRPR